jgi:hypothetical protein
MFRTSIINSVKQNIIYVGIYDNVLLKQYHKNEDVSKGTYLKYYETTKNNYNELLRISHM